MKTALLTSDSLLVLYLIYSLKWHNIVEKENNMFSRVNENEKILSKQFSPDENLLCV